MLAWVAALLVPTLLGPVAAYPDSATLGPRPFDPTPHADDAIHASLAAHLDNSLGGVHVVFDIAVHEFQLRPGLGLAAQDIRDAGPASHDAFQQAVRDSLSRTLSEALPQSRIDRMDLAVDLGSSDLDANPYEPPLRVRGSATLAFLPAAFGLATARHTSSAELGSALLRSGARLEIDAAARVPPGHVLELSIQAPAELRILRNDTRIDRGASFRSDNLLGSNSVLLPIRLGVALDPSLVPADVLRGPLVRATFTADDETPPWKRLVPMARATYRADLDLQIEISSLPLALFERDPLPSGVRADFVSAELLRIAFRESLVEQGLVYAYFEELVAHNLRASFGPDLPIRFDATAFDESLYAPGLAGVDAPLAVHASARIDLKPKAVILGSTLGRAAGMVIPVATSLPLDNEGAWATEYAVLYPAGIRVDARADGAEVQPLRVGQREGYAIQLSPGQAATLRIEGQASFDPLVLGAALVQLIGAGSGGLLVARWGRRWWRHRAGSARRLAAA